MFGPIFQFIYFICFYIYRPDLQESDGGANANTYVSKRLPRVASGNAKISLFV